MKLDETISIAEKIDQGVRDHATSHRRFEPLWRHPFLREAFLDFLYACRRDSDRDYDHAQANFVNVCALLAPEFSDIVMVVERSEIVESSVQTS